MCKHKLAKFAHNEFNHSFRRIKRADARMSIKIISRNELFTAINDDFHQGGYCSGDDPHQNLVVFHPSVLIGRRINMSSTNDLAICARINDSPCPFQTIHRYWASRPRASGGREIKMQLPTQRARLIALRLRVNQVAHRSRSGEPASAEPVKYGCRERGADLSRMIRIAAAKASTTNTARSIQGFCKALSQFLSRGDFAKRWRLGCGSP